VRVIWIESCCAGVAAPASSHAPESWPSSWPTASISPPGSLTAVMIYDRFTERHGAFLAEQEAGLGAFDVLVAEDGSCWPVQPVLHRGRCGERRLPGRGACRGLRRGDRRRPGAVRSWRRRNTGYARSRRPPPARTPRHRRYWPGPGSSRPARQTWPRETSMSYGTGRVESSETIASC